jgi:hypothetical protein
VDYPKIFIIFWMQLIKSIIKGSCFLFAFINWFCIFTIVEQRHVLFENDGECGERNTKPDTAVCGSSGISKDGMGRWQDLRGV